jgi:predicted dehydrogenase
MLPSPDRIAIVGGGNMGLRHGHCCRKIWPTAKVAVLSFHSGQQIFPSLESMDALLEWRPSLAIVANAAIDHCSSAQFLLEAAIPTLIEKPLSHDIATAQRLLSFFEKTMKAPVAMGFHLFFRRGFHQLAGWLAEGLLGKIFFIRTYLGHFLADWRPGDPKKSVSARACLGGGILREQCHDLALLLSLFGWPRKIFCRQRMVGTLPMDVADSAQLILEWDNFSGEIHLDMVAVHPRRFWEIQGERGEIRWNGRADVLEFLGNGERRSFVGKKSGHPSPYEVQLKDFWEKILRWDTSSGALRQGLEVCQLLELAERSDREGRAIGPCQGEASWPRPD